jgi:hypothetical protein
MLQQKCRRLACDVQQNAQRGPALSLEYRTGQHTPSMPRPRRNMLPRKNNCDGSSILFCVLEPQNRKAGTNRSCADLAQGEALHILSIFMEATHCCRQSGPDRAWATWFSNNSKFDVFDMAIFCLEEDRLRGWQMSLRACVQHKLPPTCQGGCR